MSRVPLLLVSLLFAVSGHAADLLFDSTGITALGVTPSATTYWTCSCVGTMSGSTLVGNYTAIIADADGDGVVRWELGARRMLPYSLWIMIDAGNGSITTRDFQQHPVVPKPFPAKAFLRDESGYYPRLAFETSQIPYNDGLYVFWVRPGVGAWYQTFWESGGLDENFLTGGAMLNLGRLYRVTGSPAPPPGAGPGDYVLLLGRYADYWTGGLVDSHLLESIGPGKFEFGFFSGSEDAKKVTAGVLRLEGTDGAASVHIETSDGTAIAGTHYQASSGTISFAPGQIMGTLDVPVVDDQVASANSRFGVTLSEASGAALGSRIGMWVPIPDNDDVPIVTIESRTINEGEGGLQEVPIRFTLNHTAPKPITLVWKSTAEYDVGPQLETGTLTFDVGEIEKTIVLHYTADRLYGIADMHLIWISITSATNCRWQYRGYLRINEDDPAPVKTVEGTAVRERDGEARVTVRLSEPVATDWKVYWTTKDGTATAGSDFTRVSGEGVIPVGSTFLTIPIPILNDALSEPAERFDVEVTWIMGLEPVIARVTIYDDDQPLQRRRVHH